MNKTLCSLLFVIILFFPQNIQAQRAECDACGYCVNRTPPENWNSCRACLYPSASEDHSSNETLELARNDQGKMEPVKKVPGTYYTQLGCLNVGAGSFSDPTAPGGVLNFLLSSLIFPIVGVLSFVSLIYGSFLLITAQGMPEQISRGKSYIVGAIVGLLFTLSAILIINILAGDILKIPGFSRTPTIVVTAGARRDGVDRDLIEDTEMAVYVNDEEVERFVIPGVNRMPQEGDFQQYSVPYAGLDLTKDRISVAFTNDYCRRYGPCGGGPNDPSANRDLIVKSISAGGEACTNFDKLWDGNSVIFFSFERATCISWN